VSAAAPPGRAARILLVTTSYPDGDEGAAAAGSFVRDFARALALRAAVTVVAPGAADRSGLEDGVRVRRFRAPRRPLSLLSPANPAHWPAILGTLHAGGRAVTESCAEGGITHILALWALPSGAWARRASRRHGVPYSIWALGSDIWTLGRIPLVRSLLRRVLRGAEHRLADGHGLCEDVAGIAGMSCAFLPSCRDLGVRELRARRAGPPYRLAFLGRWHPNKGIDLLLDALLRLEGPDWARVEEVRVFGGGPLHERVGEGIRALAARGRRVTARLSRSRRRACPARVGRLPGDPLAHREHPGDLFGRHAGRLPGDRDAGRRPSAPRRRAALRHSRSGTGCGGARGRHPRGARAAARAIRRAARASGEAVRRAHGGKFLPGCRAA